MFTRRIPGKLFSIVKQWFVWVRVILVRYIWRRPIWYKDRNHVVMELLPDENLFYYFSNQLLLDDPGSVALIQKILKPGMTVFDVGAHAGAFSLLVAQQLQGRGAIHAFEPTGATYDRLVRNIERNYTLSPCIKPNRLAVSSMNGTVTLNTFPAHLSVWNTIGKPEMEYGRGIKVMPSSSEEVTSVTVDSYCYERGIEKIDLLKIDVEGFEDEVIAGCETMIRRHAINNVLFEISLAPLEGSGKTPQSILLKFAELGFKLYKIGEDGSLREIDDISCFEVPFFANYLGLYTHAS